MSWMSKKCCHETRSQIKMFEGEKMPICLTPIHFFWQWACTSCCLYEKQNKTKKKSTLPKGDAIPSKFLTSCDEDFGLKHSVNTNSLTQMAGLNRREFIFDMWERRHKGPCACTLLVKCMTCSVCTNAEDWKCSIGWTSCYHIAL